MIFIVLFSYTNVALVYANFPSNPNGIDIINALNPSGRRNATVTVGFTLTNKGAATSVNFASSVLTGPGYTIPITAITFSNPKQIDVGTPTVPKTEAVTFTVVIPSDAAFGSYTGVITATEVGTNATATLPYTVTVTQGGGIQIVDLLNRDILSLNVKTLQRGELNERNSFKIKNAENTPLTVSFNLPVTQYTDADGDIVNIQFTPSNPTIQPNSEVIVAVRFDVSQSQDLKRYTGIMTASTQGNQFSDTLDISFDVVEDICSDGVVGDALNIDIKDPNNNDEFKPGDKVDISVNVENKGDDDLDVGVEAFLLNENGDEIDNQDGGTESIDSSNDQDFDFSITIPKNSDDIKDKNKLKLYIKAFDDNNEDEQCNVDSINLDIKLDKDDVILESTTLTPSTAICGETVGTVVKVQNIGKDDQSDVFVTLKNAALNIREVTERFTLKKFNKDQDAKATKRLEFVVPPNTKEGSYPFDVEVSFGSGDTVSDTVFLAVGQCSKTAIEEVPTEEVPQGDEGNTTPTETGNNEDTTVTGGSTTFLPTSRLFGNGAGTLFWILADIALVILAAYFIILIFRRRN